MTLNHTDPMITNTLVRMAIGQLLSYYKCSQRDTVLISIASDPIRIPHRKSIGHSIGGEKK
jgi:hypothetical protein